MTLTDVAARFARNRSPYLLAGAVLVDLVARLAVGRWSRWDLVVVVALVAVEPFAQWLIHVFVLHAKPIRLFGRTFDMVAAVEHRRHHADPRDLPLSLIPGRVLAYGTVVTLGVAALLPTWQTRLTALLTMSLMTLTYEWTHFLIHSDYKPRRALYRRLYAAHRYHHYRNEDYWFGVSRTLADAVLRTSPEPSEVPVSPTAKRLHGLPVSS